MATLGLDECHVLAGRGMMRYCVHLSGFDAVLGGSRSAEAMPDAMLGGARKTPALPWPVLTRLITPNASRHLPSAAPLCHRDTVTPAR